MAGDMRKIMIKDTRRYRAVSPKDELASLDADENVENDRVVDALECESIPTVTVVRCNLGHGSRIAMAAGSMLLLAAGASSAASAVAIWRGASASSALAGPAAAYWVAPLRRPLRVDALTFFEEKVEADSFQGRCGTIEEDTDYEVSAADQHWGFSFDHIPSLEMCCAMCHGVPRCRSWTWVKDALPDGCPSQCWLHGGAPVKKVSKAGVTSGLPPLRPTLPSAAAHKPVRDQLFCYSLMLPFGSEPELLAFQHKEHASIFACDAFAVYSNESLKVAPGVHTRVVNTSLQVKFGGDSYSALNTWIFIAVWGKVLKEGWHNHYDWLVKVDPDAVFFPERLRQIVAVHPGVGYINNCRFGLHGPLEVISATAMAALDKDYHSSFDGKAPKKCVETLHFGLWGEDFFLGQCLREVYNLKPDLDERLLCEAHCDCDDWYWCVNGTDRVSFHPFKRVDLYRQCMANAQGLGSGTAPLALASTPA